MGNSAKNYCLFFIFKNSIFGNMNVNINNTDITLKYSFRAMMIYEKIMQESFAPVGLTEVIVYFYSTVLASAKGMILTFDDFTDWLDERPHILEEFNQWLLDALDKNGYIKQNETVEEGEDVEEKKS